MTSQATRRLVIIGCRCEECGKVFIPAQTYCHPDAVEVSLKLSDTCCLDCRPQAAQAAAVQARASLVGLNSVWVLAAALWVVGVVLLYLLYHPKG